MKKLTLLLCASVISGGVFAAAPVLPTLNVNQTNADTLAKVKGLSAHKASAIVAYRKKHGAFKNADELLKVRGIGKKTLAKVRKGHRLEWLSKV